MRIKICGIKTPEMALAAAQAGADFIGLVFAQQSSRLVTIEQAKKIVAELKNIAVKIVGVFVEQDAEEIKNICQKTGITIVQLHGDNARAALPSLITTDPIVKSIIFAVPVNEQGEIMVKIPPLKKGGRGDLNSEKDYLLFDAHTAGSGTHFAWDNFHYDGKFNWFLSGGLRPENIQQALQILHPDGVDVSSGVEKNDEKNGQLIKKFIHRVRECQSVS